MNEKNHSLVNSKATMNEFLNMVREKVIGRTYSSKEDLLKEINVFKDFLENNIHAEAVQIQDFEKEILDILQVYDSQKKEAPKENYDNFSEFERENENTGATMKIENQMYTIYQSPDKNKSVMDEMKDMYNEKAIQNLDSEVEPLKDTVENNFNLLKEHTHKEVYMTNTLSSPTKIFSIPKKALQYYSQKYNTKLEYAEDSLARDENGTMYEAVVNSTGEVTIYKTKSSVVIASTMETREKIDLETIPMRDIIAFEKTKPQEEQTINFGLLEYLKQHLEGYGYREILNAQSASLSKEEIAMYEDLLKEDMEEKRRNEFMEQKNLQGDAAKVLVLEDKKEGRNGFVNALLLSVITTLFGGLCLTYFLMGILAPY